MEYTAPKRNKCLVFKIVFAAVGVLSGISIFVSFASLKNPNAAFWGLASGVFAFFVFQFHRFYYKSVLHLMYSHRTLHFAKLTGIFASWVAIVSAIIFLVLASVLKQGYQIEGNGYAPAVVFALMTFKWTFMLYWEGKKYENYILKNNEERDTFADCNNYSDYTSVT